MEIEYPNREQYAQEELFSNTETNSSAFKSEISETEQESQFQNLIVPIPRYKCKKLENKPPSLSLNDEIMLGVRANQVLKLAEATGLLNPIKLEEQTMATNSSSDEKGLFDYPAFDAERIYGEQGLNKAFPKVKLSSVRKQKMLQIVQKFREEKEKKSQNFVERFFEGGRNSTDMSIEMRLMLGRSKAVNRMASDSLDRMDELFMRIEKSTAKINGEEF